MKYHRSDLTRRGKCWHMAHAQASKVGLTLNGKVGNHVRVQRTKARPKPRDPDARPPAKLTRSADYSQGYGTRRDDVDMRRQLRIGHESNNYSNNE